MPPFVRTGHKRLIGHFQKSLSGLVVPTGVVTPVPIGQAPVGSGAGPNKPANTSRIIEFQYDGLPPEGVGQTSGFGILAGRWVVFNNAFNAVVQRSGAPVSSPNCYRFRWYQGEASGGGAIAWSARAEPSAQYTDWYESMVFNIIGDSPDGIANGATMEFPGDGAPMKPLGFWGLDSASNNDIYNGGHPVGGVLNANGNRVTDEIAMSMSAQTLGPGASWTVSSGTVRVGRWYRMEWLFLLNTIGQQDGTLRVWLTDITAGGGPVLVTDRSPALGNGLDFRTTDVPGGFRFRRFDPTWGGIPNPPTTKIRNDYVLIDHYYVAAAGAF